MTRSGDPGRRQLTANSPEELLEHAVRLIWEIPGASSFELAYDAADRTLGPDEEPGPDDRVRWTATATITHKARGRRPFVRHVAGEHVVEVGGIQARGVALAVVDLLEKLGANTVVLDLTSEADR